jgi:c-di-GMP-binding flagellar brake protein YcgR
MEDDEGHPLFERVQKKLSVFFPDMVYTRETVEASLQVGDIFYKSIDILPYLQTALFDEKIVEVELDGMTRVYLGRIHDDLPDLVPTEVDGETVLMEPKYHQGDYLKRMTHIISLPVEPGIGNLNIRNTKKILLRMFTSSYAVEFGTFFQDLTVIRELPVLRFSYPVIGRLVRGAREFRAKVPVEMNMKVLVVGKRKQDSVTTRIVDISVNGMSFSIKKNQQEFFRIDEVRTFEFIINDMMSARLKGTIRHVSKIRGKKGTEHICGVKFDLVTRALAAKIESIVATVQRAHLKELSDKSMASGLDLIA